MAKELFHAGCDELIDLNDELDWKFVSAKFKVAAPKWQKRLHAIRGAGVPHASAAKMILRFCIIVPRRCFEGDVGTVTVRRSSVWLTLLVETRMTRFRVAS